MKKPIITGRRSDSEGRRLEGALPGQEWPNPLWHKELPYGRKTIFDNELEASLANGHHWHNMADRFMQWAEYDMFERGWGNWDLYKATMAKRPCEDLTNTHDVDYHYRVHNIGMHLEMARHIPHLKPLMPELEQDFQHCTGKWQDIVHDILGRDKGATATAAITGEVENLNPSYKLKNNIVGERPLFGEEVIKERREQIKKKQQRKQETVVGVGDGMVAPDEGTRRELVKREIELNTLKRFVDDKVNENEFVRLIFIDAMGTKFYVYGMVGETLLQACRRYLIPIDGYCNGYDRGVVRIYGMGAWCHLCQMDISPKWFHLVPAYDWRERLAFLRFRHLQPTSRLGCCIWIRPDFDGMVVNIPVSLPTPYGRDYD